MNQLKVVLVLVIFERVASVAITNTKATSNGTKTLLPGIPIDAILSTPEGPGIDKTTCQGLWGQKGFLCDKPKLIDFDQKAKKQLFSTLTLYRGLLDNLAKINVLAKSQSSLKAENKEILAKLTSDGHQASAKANADECFAFYAAARSSSLCSRCALDQADHLVKIGGENKFAVSENFCSRMMAECEPHLSDLADISGLFKPKTGPISELSKLVNVSHMPKLMTADKKLQFKEILSALSSWKEATSDASKTNLSDRICAMTVSLSKEALLIAYVHQLSDVLDRLLHNLNQIGSTIKTISRSLGQFGIFSMYRSLGETCADFAQTGGDVAVLRPTDNMFTSFDGIQGSPLAVENTGNAKAMNMSVCFP